MAKREGFPHEGNTTCARTPAFPKENAYVSYDPRTLFYRWILINTRHRQ